MPSVAEGHRTHQVPVGRTCELWCFVASTTLRPSNCRARDLHWAAHEDPRQRLRSARTHRLVIPRTRLHTLGDHVFGVADARVWNALSCPRRHWLLSWQISRLTFVSSPGVFCSFFLVLIVSSLRLAKKPSGVANGPLLPRVLKI